MILRRRSHAKHWSLLVVGALALALIGCSKSDRTELVMEVPPNFSGQVHVEMGVPGAPALQQEGNRYIVTIPPDGKVATSTIVIEAQPQFGNLGADRVWGYTPSISRAGDGVPVGGNIEFFVGTREQYESDLAKKHKSSMDPTPVMATWDRS